MAAPKKIRTRAGTSRPGGSIQTPVNSQDLAAAVEQLQATVNELIVRFNAHTHSGVTAGGASTGTTSSAVDGSGQAAADKFTTAATS